jgi:WD40 repeat protein
MTLEKKTLADLLDDYMERLGIGEARLANEVNQMVNQPHFIHRSSIRNWRNGGSKTAGNWRQITAIAEVLHLNEVEANELLVAAGHPTIRQLWLEADEEDRPFLVHWMEPAPLRGIDNSLKEIRDDVKQIWSHTVLQPGGSPPLLPPAPRIMVENWQYQSSGGITSVAVSADGSRVVAGSLAKVVLGLDGFGKLRWQSPVTNQAWRISISADGQVTAAGTGSSRPWDLKGRGVFCFDDNGTERWNENLAASVWDVAVSADGSTIAVGTSGAELIVYDADGHALWRQKVSRSTWYWVWGTAISADGQIVVAGTANNQVRLANRDGDLLAIHRVREDVFSVDVSADGRIIAAGDRAGYVYLLDTGGNLLWEELILDKIWYVRLSRDGNRLLVGAGAKEAHLRVYDQGGRLVWRRYVGGTVNCLDLSVRGQVTAVGTREGEIYLFDGAGNIVHKKKIHKLVRDIAISITGNVVVAGSEDGLVHGFRLGNQVDEAVS